MGSRMDRTDVNERSFYMEMMQAVTEKERCKLKMCLSDKLVVVAFLPNPHSSYLLPGQPSCLGTVPYTRRRELEQVRKQMKTLVSFIRGISFADITRQKDFQVRG